MFSSRALLSAWVLNSLVFAAFVAAQVRSLHFFVLFVHRLIHSLAAQKNLHSELAAHCAQFNSCKQCSADPQCGYCLDDMAGISRIYSVSHMANPLSGGQGSCLSGGCSSGNWVGRGCKDTQLQCINAFKDLFPGSTFAEGFHAL